MHRYTNNSVYLSAKKCILGITSFKLKTLKLKCGSFQYFNCLRKVESCMALFPNITAHYDLL